VTMTLIIGIAAFIGVTALVGGVALVLRDKPGNKIEDRLDVMTGLGVGESKGAGKKQASVLTQPLDESPGVFETVLKKVTNINLDRLLSQADASLTSLQFGITCGVMALVGAAAGLFLGLNLMLVPLNAVNPFAF